MAWRFTASADAADTFYVGGDIVAVDERRPDAEALAVKDGKTVAVGGPADIEQAHTDAASGVHVSEKEQGFITKVKTASGMTSRPSPTATPYPNHNHIGS